MSVKKSLWIGIALAAVALLIGACSTEDSDSDGGSSFSYQKTALWEAASAARTNLVATKITVKEGADAGKDIGKSDRWVSPIQYNEFNKAITDAEAAAEALGRSALAIEPTPAEQEYLDKLAAAQKQFDSYKTAGLATEVIDAAGITTNLALPAIVKQNIPFSAGGTLSSFLTIEDATLTVSGSTATAINGVVGVKEGGTLVLDLSANGSRTGQIILYSGATSIDKQVTFSLVTDTGSTIVHAGAVVKNTPSANQLVVLIGPDKGDNKGQVFQLTAGTLTLGPVVGTGSYTLKGDATLVSKFDSVASSPTATVKLNNTSTLTIANKGILNSTTNVDFLGTSENGAKIVVAAGGSITVTGTSLTHAGVNAHTPLAPAGFEWDVNAGQTEAKIAGPVTLVKTAAGWTKQ
jgi:hypothetical protein